MGCGGEKMNEYKLKAITISGEYIEQSLNDFYEINQFIFEIGEQLKSCIVVRWDNVVYRFI